MGPRLLRNFLRDRGNQVALGLFLMTFCYAIALQRGMGTEGTPPVPHLGLVLAVGLALICASSLAWVVHHIAGGINVETVIAIVHAELADAAERLTTEQAPGLPLALAMPAIRGTPLRCAGTGYVRALDTGSWRTGRSRAAWCSRCWRGRRLPVSRPAHRRGERGGPGRGRCCRAARGHEHRAAPSRRAGPGIRRAPAGRGGGARALARHQRPLHRHGGAGPAGGGAGGPVGRHLPAPVLLRDDAVVLYRRVSDYPGLCDAMFHMIRQAGAEHAAVLIRMAEVLEQAADMEPDATRRAVLLRHGRWVLRAGRARITDAPGRAGLERACASLAAHG